MKIFKIVYAVIVSASFLVSVPALAADQDPLAKLLDGNKRFITAGPAKKDISDEKRKELAKGQHPFAIVLTCSDSRVPPEIVFDQGLGDIFVVRDAGNVADPIVVGSIEYAAEHLHAPLLIVLGHSSCGAVKAAVEAEGAPEGNIGEIIKEILPAVKAAKASGKKDVLDAAVQENVKNTCTEIVKRSPLIQELVKEGKLRIIAGEYYLDSGEVKPLNAPIPVKEEKKEKEHAAVK